MKTARDWRDYYARERERLGAAGVNACLARAEALGDLAVTEQTALVFPHTRLEASGELPAAAALTILRSGCETVLALGVLHGGRVQDAGLVQQARAGEERARSRLRRVHGPGAPEDLDGCWEEEFSLDNFCVLLEAAAHRLGKRPLQVIRRYPFLVGDCPGDLPGLEELQQWIARGAFLVATTDPIHHGAGYGTPAADGLALDEAATQAYARRTIEHSFGLLAARDYCGFQHDALAVRSDFRDAGPVMAYLLPGARLQTVVRQLKLVDYSHALAAPVPTWVAAALATFEPSTDPPQGGFLNI